MKLYFHFALDLREGDDSSSYPGYLALGKQLQGPTPFDLHVEECNGCLSDKGLLAADFKIDFRQLNPDLDGVLPCFVVSFFADNSFVE